MGSRLFLNQLLQRSQRYIKMMAATMLRSSWKMFTGNAIRQKNIRNATNTTSGAMLPEPRKTPFGLIGVVCAVVPGLLIGATISKNIASFLEENDLFVPSDDDDDDD